MKRDKVEIELLGGGTYTVHLKAPAFEGLVLHCWELKPSKYFGYGALVVLVFLELAWDPIREDVVMVMGEFKTRNPELIDLWMRRWKWLESQERHMFLRFKNGVIHPLKNKEGRHNATVDGDLYYGIKNEEKTAPLDVEEITKEEWLEKRDK